MTSKIYSIAHLGLRCQLVEVEADVSRHLPGFVLVGLPDAAIQEARERIRSALENSHLPFPRSKVTVNLAPANVRKEGSMYDLAIALSILRSQDVLSLRTDDAAALYVGELSLSGLLRPVKGVLLTAFFARDHGIKHLYVPEENAREASYVKGVRVYGIRTLEQLVQHLQHARRLRPMTGTRIPAPEAGTPESDLADVRGQYQAKRALEIAAAGGHNVLLSGVPGSGKTMLAKCLPSIMPDLAEEEVFEVSKIYSYAGLLTPTRSLVHERPFRSPHHTASVASIVGGGTWPRPGEITLAHRGILFLDEFPEFPRSVLEALRQPLEDKVVSISRVSSSLQFPAHVTLVAAQNPCPCGYFGSSEKQCICTEVQRQHYRKRISGPLLDRIDLQVRVAPVERGVLLDTVSSESSAMVRERVCSARAIQRRRFAGKPVWFLNGDMDHKLMKQYCALDAETHRVLLEASTRLALSARSFYKTIKIARTIADLAQRHMIIKDDILEALQYRIA